MHWLSDADIGGKLLVVTGLGPTRGLIKSQDFVDLRALASAQGIAIQPIADDLAAELAADKVIVVRPGGLTLSDAAAPQEQHKAARALTFDTRRWSLDRDAEYTQREFDLVRAAADAPLTGRTARGSSCRGFISRGICTPKPRPCSTRRSPTSAPPRRIRRRSCSAPSPIMLGHVEDAQKDLANPVVGNQNDAPLWRAVALPEGEVLLASGGLVDGKLPPNTAAWLV